MRNEFAPGQFNNFDLMGKQANGERGSLPEVQTNEFWLENSRLLFQTIKEIYASSAPDERMVISYLVERRGVPENLARASIHAFHEIADERFGKPLKEAKLSLLLKLYQQNKNRQFSSNDVKVITDDQGQPMTYDQASQALASEGISLRLNPNLDRAVRTGTADTEANQGMGVNAYGQSIVR